VYLEHVCGTLTFTETFAPSATWSSVTVYVTSHLCTLRFLNAISQAGTFYNLAAMPHRENFHTLAAIPQRGINHTVAASATNMIWRFFNKLTLALKCKYAPWRERLRHARRHAGPFVNTTKSRLCQARACTGTRLKSSTAKIPARRFSNVP